MAGSSFLLWMAAAAIGVVTVAPELDRAVSIPKAVPSGGMPVPRATDGQFYVDGKIGAVPVRFLVDGSTDGIVLSGTDAERLGLDPMASGEVILPEIAIGPNIQAGASARIAPSMPVSLIGRAALK